MKYSIAVKLILVALIGSMSNAIFGAEFGTFSVQFDKRLQDWTWQPISNGGWDGCYADPEVSYDETYLNHKGEYKSRSINERGTRNGKVLLNPRMEVQFTRNISPDRLKTANTFKVRLTCWQDTTTYSTDSNGNATYTTDTDYTHATLECSTGELPNHVEESFRVGCQVTESSSARPLSDFNKLSYIAKFQMVNKQTSYDVTLCNGGKEKHVIQLRQGVAGHMGENDFIFYVQIDDGRKFEIKSKDGILDKEILYCSDKKDVKVAVTAIEKDLFFNDQYKTIKGQESVILNLDSAKIGKISLKRKGYFGMTAKDNEIMVRVIPTPEMKAEIDSFEPDPFKSPFQNTQPTHAGRANR